MKKFDRMEAFVDSLKTGGNGGLHPCYAGYFTCFNRGEYYEAHDVLEHLWLQCEDANEPFYKGLIQLAGGFVHLRKQHLRPGHPKDGRRLAPASRLFDLAAKNLAPFAPRHLRLDVDAALALAADSSHKIRASNYGTNPWNPAHPPQLFPE
jgi:predicted metal-dependent hydrolase